MTDPLHLPEFPPTIAAGPDLRLRVLASPDAQALHPLIDRDRDDLALRLPWPRFVKELGDSIAFCEASERKFAERSAAIYGIWSGPDILGVVSFNAIDLASGAADIGYWLGTTARGRGIATQAVAALVGAYGERGLLRRFVIKCAVGNERSRRIAERLGFAREAVLERAEKLGDTWHDQYLYALSPRGA